MSTTVYIDSTAYDIPVTDETGWGDDVTAWIIDASAKITARHTYLNNASLDLYELTANGTDKISIKAPGDVGTGGYTITLPADPSAGLLSMDAVGNILITTPLSLDYAYDNGADIYVDAGRISVIVSENTDGLFVNKTGTGAGYPVRIDNAGTASGLLIVQAGVAAALELYQGGSHSCLVINKADTWAGEGIDVTNLGLGHGIKIAQSGAGRAIDITLTADASWGIAITNHGANDTIYVDTDTGGKGFRIDQSGGVIGGEINQAGGADGFVVNQSGAGRSIYLNHTATGADPVLAILNAGVGDGIQVTANANGQAGYFTKAAGTGALPCVYVNNFGTGAGIHVVQTTGAAPALKVEQNAASYGVQIVRWNTGGTYPALHAQNDGAAGSIMAVNTHITGVSFIAEGTGTNGTTAQFNHMGAGTGNVIEIDNDGTGYDIQGSDAAWHITKAGDTSLGALTIVSLDVTAISGATVQGKTTLYGLVLHPSTKTIGSGGTITVADTDSFIRLDTYASGATDDLDSMSGGSDGQILVFGSAADARDPIFTRAGGAGGFLLGAATRRLNLMGSRLVVQYDSALTKWCELSYSDNA
jgi:hypothetical protein